MPGTGVIKDCGAFIPMPEQLVTPRLLSTKSAAIYIGVSVRTIGPWIAERLVANRKIGGPG